MRLVYEDERETFIEGANGAVGMYIRLYLLLHMINGVINGAFVVVVL